MKEKLLIIGASGHGKVAADIALKMNKWSSIVFLDDNDSIKTSMGIEVIGKSCEFSKYLNDFEIFVGIGNNIIRKKLLQKLETEKACLPVLIHPFAIIGEQVELGAGTIVMAGVVINCCTRIGKGCIINTGATVDHDNLIKNYVHVSPGVNLAGAVTVGEQTWLGIGCTVSNNIEIACECKIGAGAVVTRDLTEPGTYIGVPVRRI